MTASATAPAALTPVDTTVAVVVTTASATANTAQPWSRINGQSQRALKLIFMLFGYQDGSIWQMLDEWER